jgi:hypothetical protein
VHAVGTDDDDGGLLILGLTDGSIEGDTLGSDNGADAASSAPPHAQHDSSALLPFTVSFKKKHHRLGLVVTIAQSLPSTTQSGSSIHEIVTLA